MAKYFNDKEFACQCGCGKQNIDPKLVEALDWVREISGFPFVVTSGCRCNEHNERIGGATYSPHMEQADGFCHGVDIRVRNSTERFLFISSALTRFDRIGIGRDFIHLDNLHDGKHIGELIWTYYKKER